MGEDAFTRLQPTPIPAPYLVTVSEDLASELGIAPSALRDTAWLEVLAGNRMPEGSDPLATVYSGHQFGVWAGQLGDGRALLIGRLTGAAGFQEVQLKGAGRTPYSRMGDGRAVLRSSIREFLCSEAMAALGIPTTRALSVVGSDLPVRRETMETAAVVARVAPSFVRFGHFEHFSYSGQHDALQRLADHVIDDFYPHCRMQPNPAQALLREVTLRTAELVAAWQAVGFCHGVMNTDNMSILGLTIDYGPFGFLDGFDARHICNHSDTQGRYAYNAQPQIAHWNLFCLAQAMLPLLDPALALHPDDEGARQRAIDAAQQALEPYREAYGTAFLRRFRAKLGLAVEHPQDTELLSRLFEILQAGRVDFTIFFRRLGDLRRATASDTAAGSCPAGSGQEPGDAPLRDLFVDRGSWDQWAQDYRARLAHEQRSDDERRTAMHRVNPKYVLRNHLAELAIRKAGAHDFSEVSRLQAVLSRPFDEQPENEAYAALPPDWAGSLEISCSS